MQRIRVLDSQVVDRIAAGEVVERPASVVKELVENSLDAGASRVEVRIQAGGCRVIEVLDDGHGMSPEDAQLAFIQHATSKIHAVDDLEHIETLGFRGEALASVGAVAQVELLTATDDGPGVRVRVRGGEPPRVEAAAAPVGTRIAVRELFYNTPARRKHLRTERTEAGRIAAVMEDFALLRPDVHFVLRQDGQDRLVAPPVSSLAERVHQVLGAAVAEAWLEVEEEGSYCRITGGITRPEEHRAGRQHVHLFVNGRAIADGRLVHAVTSGYDTMLPRGRYPLAALHIQVDADAVDVNVHPRKAEVRFVEPGAVYGTLRRAVTTALAGQLSPPRLSTTGPAEYPRQATEVREAAPSGRPARSTLPLGGWLPVPGDSARSEAVTPRSDRLRVVGAIQPLSQLANTYILAADDQGLLVIDQHVAHERILFERILRQRAEEAVRVQRLLVPETLELSGRESAAAEEHAEVLAHFGFEIEPFGGNTWTLRGVPEVLGRRSGEDVVRALLETLDAQGSADAAEKLEREVAASIACHSAVRAHQPLNAEAMGSLLADLSECEQPMHCPHGRPVMLRLSLDQIEREIGRH